MKLAALVFITALGLGGYASADDYAPPPPAGPQVRPGRVADAQLKQMLVSRFDRDHDGRLSPQERRRALRALRRIERRLAMRERRVERRAQRERGIIRRYDVNGDGRVGPEEMPPGLADKLRPLDRNGDGWLDDRDQ